jgi:uncharacterized protein YprB with RNaseH-like and TPR domain
LMPGGARDFRARLREVARARGHAPRGEIPADGTVALGEIWPAARRNGCWLASPGWPAGYPGPARLPAGEAWAFDVESLGRTPKPLIVVGFAHLSGAGVAFEQYVAAHPEEEPAALEAAYARLVAAPALISYNGLTFDLAILRDRLRRWRLPYEAPRRHFDLLRLVRRHYRERLGMPACGLAEAERYILGLERPADIQSSQVPTLYETAVKLGDARPLRAVLQHNLYDLAATALLYEKMAREAPAAFAADEPPPESQSLF